MAALATKVALQAVKLGSDKVPDKVWDQIPGMRPPKEEREEHEREKRKSKSKRHDKDDSRRHRHRSEGPDSRNGRHRDRYEEDDRERTARRRRANSYDPHASDEGDSDSDGERRRRRRHRDRDDKYGHDRPPQSFDRSGTMNPPVYSPPGSSGGPPAPGYNPAMFNAPHGQHVPHPAAPPMQSRPPPPLAYAVPSSTGATPQPSRSASVQAGAPGAASYNPPYANSPQLPAYAHPQPAPPQSYGTPPPPRGTAPPPTHSYQTPTPRGPAIPSKAANRYTPAGFGGSPVSAYAPPGTQR